MKVNELLESEKLIFVAEVWKPPVFIKNKKTLLNYNAMEDPIEEIVYNGDDDIYELDDGIPSDNSNIELISKNKSSIETQPPAPITTNQDKY